MALDDTKKVQTMINIVGQQMLIVQAAVSAILDVRAAYLAAAPDITGTALEGNISAINSAINTINTDANSATWDSLINSIVPSHNNNGLN